MSYTIIAALDQNGLIGANNNLPWKLPKDMQLFKKNTLHKKILMGRKTCDSFKEPLIARENYVLTRSKTYCKNGFIIIHNCNKLDELKEEIMIIGGAKIYQLFLTKADKMILTHIHHSFTGDTFFPQWDSNEWVIKKSTFFAPNEKNHYGFDLTEYIRKDIK